MEEELELDFLVKFVFFYVFLSPVWLNRAHLLA